MLTDEQLSDLQERLSLARLMDREEIAVDVKVLQALLDDYFSILKNIEFLSETATADVTILQAAEDRGE